MSDFYQTRVEFCWTETLDDYNTDVFLTKPPSSGCTAKVGIEIFPSKCPPGSQLESIGAQIFALKEHYNSMTMENYTTRLRTVKCQDTGMSKSMPFFLFIVNVLDCQNVLHLLTSMSKS